MSISFGKDGSNLLQLSNGTEIIKIKPGSIIKLNGKEGRFTGFDFQKRSVGFSTLDSDHIKYFKVEEIKKIQLLKEGWVFSNMINQAGVGHHQTHVVCVRGELPPATSIRKTPSLSNTALHAKTNQATTPNSTRHSIGPPLPSHPQPLSFHLLALSTNKPRCHHFTGDVSCRPPPHYDKGLPRPLLWRYGRSLHSRTLRIHGIQQSRVVAVGFSSRALRNSVQRRKRRVAQFILPVRVAHGTHDWIGGLWSLGRQSPQGTQHPQINGATPSHRCVRY